MNIFPGYIYYFLAKARKADTATIKFATNHEFTITTHKKQHHNLYKAENHKNIFSNSQIA